VTDYNIQPIETVYRGYRFRSRTEARWAVFLDAAGIEWQYEPEGYVVNGRGYLPDFWLPQLKTFVEVKPHMEACEEEQSTMEALVLAKGNCGLLIAGQPNVDGTEMMLASRYDVIGLSNSDGVYTDESSWRQCRFCNQVILKRWWLLGYRCNCLGSAEVLTHHFGRELPPRVKPAFAEAQRARFEDGENGQPRPYVPPCAPTSRLNVYIAGPVLEDGPKQTIVPWRRELFGECPDIGSKIDVRLSEYPLTGSKIIGRFHYAAPGIVRGHGGNFEELAPNCLNQVRRAETVFAWIDRPDTIGTIAEIGAAHALNKKIFVALSEGSLSTQFYFARQLTDVSIVAPSAAAAWDLFIRWQNGEEKLSDEAEQASLEKKPGYSPVSRREIPSWAV
jgi:hypothetical protein